MSGLQAVSIFFVRIYARGPTAEGLLIFHVEMACAIDPCTVLYTMVRGPPLSALVAAEVLTRYEEPFMHT